MTSSGQVTMPDAMPADAPQKALTDELGRWALFTARLEKSEFRLRGFTEVSSEAGGGVGGGGSWASSAVLASGGVSGSAVIVDAVHDIWIRGQTQREGDENKEEEEERTGRCRRYVPLVRKPRLREPQS